MIMVAAAVIVGVARVKAMEVEEAHTVGVPIAELIKGIPTRVAKPVDKATNQGDNVLLWGEPVTSVTKLDILGLRVMLRMLER